MSDISLHPSATGSDAPQALPVVIVGAGLAAWTVVRELRKLDAQRRIVMLSSDSADFYAKPTLSNALAQKRSADQLVTTPAAKMAETLQVQLLPHTRVNSLDTGARALSYDDATGQSHSLHFGDLDWPPALTRYACPWRVARRQRSNPSTTCKTWRVSTKCLGRPPKPSWS